jgi:predicted AAA+ superfamily ATPase
MISRSIFPLVLERLKQFPAVALLGPRQVGKTTLALQVAAQQQAVYLDLEAPQERIKLQDPILYFKLHTDKLIILDEVHRFPELFNILRGWIDTGKRAGLKNGRFLLLGSASPELLRQSGESLAGRIAYLELQPFNLTEVGTDSLNALWLRGGFPNSFSADTDAQSMIWRQQFLRTYLERDIPQFSPRLPTETLRRLMVMLAHLQGSLFNASELGRSLGIDSKTVSRYIDLLTDLLLLRRLEPYHINIGKRLVKSPKIYLRDSGIVHTLLGITLQEQLLSHPVAGGSWEGFIIENILSVTPEGTTAYFYRTTGGAEADLILILPNQDRYLIEIKRSLTPQVSKGFYAAQEDIAPQSAFVVYAGTERYPLKEKVTVISLSELLSFITSLVV